MKQITTASTLMALAIAYKLIHQGDQTAEQAADRAVVQMLDNVAYEFDGNELRVLSTSPNAIGLWYRTDGVYCTCNRRKQSACFHRALYALLLAEAVLQSPLMLRTQIIEQIASAQESMDELGETACQGSAAV